MASSPRQLSSACPRVAEDNRYAGDSGGGSAAGDTAGEKDTASEEDAGGKERVQVGRIQMGTLLVWMLQVGTIQGSILQVGLHTAQVGYLRLGHTHRWFRPALCLSLSHGLPYDGQKERSFALDPGFSPSPGLTLDCEPVGADPQGPAPATQPKADMTSGTSHHPL